MLCTFSAPTNRFWDLVLRFNKVMGTMRAVLKKNDTYLSNGRGPDIRTFNTSMGQTKRKLDPTFPFLLMWRWKPCYQHNLVAAHRRKFKKWTTELFPGVYVYMSIINFILFIINFILSHYILCHYLYICFYVCVAWKDYNFHFVLQSDK